MSDFKKGDLVLYVYNKGWPLIKGLKLGEVYTIEEINKNDRYVKLTNYDSSHSYKYWSPHRFRKLRKIPSTKIAKLLCKIYKEEDGYLYI